MLERSPFSELSPVSEKSTKPRSETDLDLRIAIRTESFRHREREKLSRALRRSPFRELRPVSENRRSLGRRRISSLGLQFELNRSGKGRGRRFRQIRDDEQFGDMTAVGGKLSKREEADALARTDFDRTESFGKAPAELVVFANSLRFEGATGTERGCVGFGSFC